MSKYRYEIIGSVDVDSGLLMIGDPCYTLGDKWDEEDYSAMGNALFKGDRTEDKMYTSIAHEGGWAGKGVVFSTAWGDGSYPVIAIWETEPDDEFPYISGRPTQVFVDTNPDYDENDEYKLPAWVNL